MPKPTGRAPAWRQLRVGTKFTLAVGVLLLAVVIVAVGAALFLATTHQQASQLFSDHLKTTETTADLGDALDDVEEAALLRAQPLPTGKAARLDAELDANLIPWVLQLLTAVRAIDADDRQEISKLDQIQSGFAQHLQFRRTGGYGPSVPRAPAPAVAAGAEGTAAIFDRITAIAGVLRVEESRLAARKKVDADRSYRSAQLLLGAGVGGSLLLAAIVALLLSRNLVPRIRRYADFAGRLAAGQPTVPLATAGSDELTAVGGWPHVHRNC